MKLTAVRNATVLLEYGGVRLLIDPMLGAPGSLSSWSSFRPGEPNPCHPLPFPAERLTEVDAVLVTHFHEDHFDETAIRLLPKELPLFCQNAHEREQYRAFGFLQAAVLQPDTLFRGIRMTPAGGRHGDFTALAGRMGPVMGVVFQAAGEPTVYLAGDTVYCPEVEEALERFSPAVVLLNAGDCALPGGRLIMNADDVYSVHREAPESRLVAVHMEGVNHWRLSRGALRRFAEEKGFSEFLQIPEDGESLSF